MNWSHWRRLVAPVWTASRKKPEMRLVNFSKEMSEKQVVEVVEVRNKLDVKDKVGEVKDVAYLLETEVLKERMVLVLACIWIESEPG